MKGGDLCSWPTDDFQDATPQRGDRGGRHSRGYPRTPIKRSPA
jgi:hypothetical protein